MNLLLLFPEDFTARGQAVLSGRRHEHLSQTLKARVGDLVTVGLVGGLVGKAAVVDVCPGATTLAPPEQLRPPPPPLPATLVVALPRPKTLRKTLQAATALGVKRFYFIETWKVEKSYWDSPALEPEDIREQLVLGLEQAVDTTLPTVEFRRRFKPFVEDELPALAAGTLALTGHPGAELECPRDVRRDVTLAIGPEGGFTTYEVGMLERAGFAAVGLGPRILRVEHAVTVLLGRLF